MVVSRILKGKCVYYHLHAEQVIDKLIDKGGIGLSEGSITLSTFDMIIEDSKSYAKPDINLILNFSSIYSCQANIIQKINSIIGLYQSVVFINILKEIIEKSDLSIFSNTNNIENGKYYAAFYLNNRKSKVRCELDAYKLFSEAFDAKVVGYLDKHNGKRIIHHSSSVYLSCYIDIKKFICIDNPFFLYAIYFLSLKTLAHWRDEFKEKRITLICQNLNSSFIASILSSILKVNILILDQIGPINKLYSILDKKIENDQKYLIVSDMVCLGTEIKIVKNLIDFLGGNYLGNISVISVESLKKNDKENMDSECIYNIDYSVSKKLGYEISTALNFQ